MRIGIKTTSLAFVLAGLTGCGMPDGQEASAALSSARPTPKPAPPSTPALPQVQVCTSLGVVGSHQQQLGGVPKTLLADLNRDGLADLVIGGGELFFSVELGQAGGGFGAPINLAIDEADDTDAFTVGDLNGDGVPDLAVSLGYDFSALQLFWGNGDGHFTTGPTLHGSDALDSLDLAVIADVNHDGRNDLVGGNGSNSSVSVFLGDGKGGFAASLDRASISSETLAVVDLNNDGKLDLLSPYTTALGNGDGTFGTPVYSKTMEFYWSMVTGDFNGDGKLDVAGVGGFTSNGALTAGIALGKGDGTFGTPTQLGGDRAYSLNGNAALALDADHDGHLDLALDTAAAGTIILFGDGSGQFTRRQDLGVTVGGALSSAASGTAIELVTTNFTSSFGGFRCGS
jgi:hypothetical protein